MKIKGVFKINDRQTFVIKKKIPLNESRNKENTSKSVSFK